MVPTRVFRFPRASVTAACIVVALPLAAQQTRDSAGIRITMSTRPTVSGVQAPRLAATPGLVIGNRTGREYEFGRVAGAVRLADGRIVVADAMAREMRYYDAAGTYLKTVGRPGDGPGEFGQLGLLARLPGDTLVAGYAYESQSLFTADGVFIQRFDLGRLPVSLPPAPQGALAVMSGGTRVIAALAQPRPRGANTPLWTDSMPQIMVDRDNRLVRDLGIFASWQLAMDGAQPRQPWFGASSAYATDGTWYYYGYAGEYSIRRYDARGRLAGIIRRSWTPARVTPNDIDEYVVEWGKLWIKETGTAAERRRADLQDDPYATTVPAFSQIIADGAGRLWVREANLKDAPGSGGFSALPLVPSMWSVFDAGGTWLTEVTMPARFMPTDIGSDYVLGRASDADGVQTVVMYALGPRR